MSERYHENSTNEQPNPQPDYEAQQAARKAVMAIAKTRGLWIGLTRVFGPCAERDMIWQLIYWFSKPRMQHRWTAYLTRKNWLEQCGLNRKQVDKGRARLRVHPSGVVEEKMGPYKRVHYQVDWVALAEVLRIPLKGVPMDDFDPFFDDVEDESLRTPPRGVPKPSAPPKGDTGLRPPLKGVPSNTGEYAGDYFQDSYALQASGEPAKAEPPPRHMNGKEEEKDARASFSDNRHSQNGHTPSEKKAAKEVVSEPPPPAKPDNHTLLAEVREILNPDGRRWPDAHYIKKNFSFHMAEKVAGYIVTNAEDIELPEVATSAPREELVKAVAYVMWGAA